jgi:hypothetical protein
MNAAFYVNTEWEQEQVFFWVEFSPRNIIDTMSGDS